MVPVLSKVLSIPCAPCNLSIAVFPHFLRLCISTFASSLHLLVEAGEVVVNMVGVDKVEHFLIHLSNFRHTDGDILPLSFRVSGMS